VAVCARYTDLPATFHKPWQVENSDFLLGRTQTNICHCSSPFRPGQELRRSFCLTVHLRALRNTKKAIVRPYPLPQERFHYSGEDALSCVRSVIGRRVLDVERRFRTLCILSTRLMSVGSKRQCTIWLRTYYTIYRIIPSRFARSLFIYFFRKGTEGNFGGDRAEELLANPERWHSPAARRLTIWLKVGSSKSFVTSFGETKPPGKDGSLNPEGKGTSSGCCNAPPCSLCTTIEAWHQFTAPVTSAG
jgi:hypothetical protein